MRASTEFGDDCLSGISIFFLPLSIIILIMLFSAAALPQEQKLDLNFKKNKLTADIKNTPLKKVLNAFGNEKDIEINTGFIKNPTILQDNISLEVQNVSIQEGLDRILSGINYCLFFKGDAVVGVMLFGEPGTRSYRSRRSYRPRTRRRP